MNYCTQCGSTVVSKIPEGDHLPRFVCENCQTIHYQNPKIVAGCIAKWQQKILLCKRAIEPRYGLWTLPAGFMENGETTLQAAVRESWEEANASLNDVKLFAVFNLPHINQVYMMFQANLIEGKASAGQESLEVQLFNQDDVPWEQLAFRVIEDAIKLYFDNHDKNPDHVHFVDIHHLENKKFATHVHQ